MRTWLARRFIRLGLRLMGHRPDRTLFVNAAPDGLRTVRRGGGVRPGRRAAAGGGPGRRAGARGGPGAGRAAGVGVRRRATHKDI